MVKYKLFLDHNLQGISSQVTLKNKPLNHLPITAKKWEGDLIEGIPLISKE